MAKKFVITTHSKKTTAPAPDRLQRVFRAEDKNRAWVSDSTFIRTREGCLYLALIQDLYSRQVIGWAVADCHNTKLVANTLIVVTWRRGKFKDVIVHSDRGGTYAFGDDRKLLSEYGLIYRV